MHLTSNYELKKPETTDVYDIGNENDNMDIIDAALANTNGNIAPIEWTDKASRQYAVGAQLIYNGILHKVDAAISQDDDLVVGGNISVSPKISSQLATLNTQLTQCCTPIFLASINSNGSKHIALSNYIERGAYLLACVGGIGATLAVYAGVGYGEESARHKLSRIAGESTQLIVTVSDTDFGIDITNNSAGGVNVYIVFLSA